MHVSKSSPDILCPDLHVGSWCTEVITDQITGKSSLSESYKGLVKMKVKTEQVYLGDLVSSDGTHTKKVQNRSNKAIGTINQIMSILEATYFGKYYFEVAVILRQSLFLSSILLNSEAWINYTEKDVRILEQCDENLLTKILGCDYKSSNTFKYLELGIVPIRFEIMKRKLSFLKYLLNQEEKSMVYQVLKATQENPSKSDFMTTCQKYLKALNMNISIAEIQTMSKYRFSKLLKNEIKNAAFLYLKEQQCKQEKIKDIKYSKLEMQDYLANGDRNISSKNYLQGKGQDTRYKNA